ncbi:unnamed protein product [Protopolystoma xenopodis]|uniref:Uncharacterized protein n=1 Tax=Protopolystoma xenopodis TaxID=117903 RepID=A0A3S5A3Q8_9PLAT|nr:unnamed protein product [Protopolystoma xenopodis]
MPTRMLAKRLGMYHVRSPTLEMIMHTMDSGQVIDGVIRGVLASGARLIQYAGAAMDSLHFRGDDVGRRVASGGSHLKRRVTGEVHRPLQVAPVDAVQGEQEEGVYGIANRIEAEKHLRELELLSD